LNGLPEEPAADGDFGLTYQGDFRDDPIGELIQPQVGSEEIKGASPSTRTWSLIIKLKRRESKWI
jgi:hypothetical protein